MAQQSVTDELYRAARASATFRAAAHGPVPLAKREVRRRIYRKQGTWTRAARPVAGNVGHPRGRAAPTRGPQAGKHAVRPHRRPVVHRHKRPVRHHPKSHHPKRRPAHHRKAAHVAGVRRHRHR